tara:strand:+ start:323 stop:610 length:288 start_codon:yes stop_codon:yes gene_type:complete
MSKENSNPGNIKKEGNYKRADYIYSYRIGKEFQVELVNNMIYYKRKDSFGNFNLMKATEAPTKMYGHSELKELALDISKKMGLPLTSTISGSVIS